LAAVLLVFAGLSVYDFTKIRAGMPTEILLQLPIGLKKSIHTAIRTRVRTVTLAGSSLALGFLVSVFEFACTGQVYLPTLAYLVRGRTRALPLLLLYNFGFIVPLLAVFAAAYFGVGSKRIAGLFQRHMAAVKIGLALFFLCLAVVTLAG
jgi:cytochrome c biogenesis protein CcdA